MVRNIIYLVLFISFNLNAQQHIQKSDTVSITILQTADIHGQLDSHPELFWQNGKVVFNNRGGLAHIKTLFDREKNANPGRTLIIDGGDLIQGSGYAELSDGDIFPPIIKLMGYDLIVPGNWEVVYGKEVMVDVLSRFRTPIVVQNMHHLPNGEPLFPPYLIKDIEGIRFGFIGINDPDVPVRQNPIFSKGIGFSPIDNKTGLLINQLKDDKKVDVLFLVTHLGIFKQVDLANSKIAEQVDYILGNDTHERVRSLIHGKYAKVTEPGAFGSFVGKLVLHFIDGKLVGDEYELIEVDPEIYKADAKIQRLIRRLKKPYRSFLEEVVGFTSEPLFRYLTVENPMDNMITDAIRWKTKTDIAISNGFRFGNPIVPEDGKLAPITRANLWNLLPQNEEVKVGKVSGEQIKIWLENELHNAFAVNPKERFGGWMVRFSGMEVKFESMAAKGNRIREITVAGKPIKEDRYYSIAACERPGDPEDNLCRISNVREVALKDYTIHQVMEEYLKVNSPISPKLDGRSFAIDLDRWSFSTVPGTNYEFK